MVRAAVILALFLPVAVVRAATPTEFAREVVRNGLDPAQCYRVRELTLTKEDARIYLTDGYLIFGKAIDGAHVSAVFVTDVDGGDAELLVFPPTKSERQSLASFSGAPNLNEHFRSAAFLFTDATFQSLNEQIQASPSSRKSPEMGLLLAPQWDPVLRNLSLSFESRLILDLLTTPRREAEGIFFAAFTGMKLGKFDLVYDPRAEEQITIGQTVFRDNKVFFDVWTAFEARSFRQRSRALAKADFTLSNYRIDATITPPDLRLQVTTKITVKAGEQAASIIPLEISKQMRVTAASVDGRAAEVFEREALRSNLILSGGNQLFLLIPAEPLAPGREYDLEIRHEGAVIADAGNRVYLLQARSNWYPARGRQRAQFDLTFHYPKDLDLVASGDVVSDTATGESRTTRWRTPTAIRVAGFNLGVYDRVKLTRGGLTVEVCANRSVERALEVKPREPVMVQQPQFPVPGRRGQPPQVFNTPIEAIPPPSPAARLNLLASEIASALEFMASRFGPPPLRTLTVSPVPAMFGQGFPGLIYLSTLSYLGPKDRPIAALRESSQTFFGELLHAHETAHQWWGNLVTSARYQDDWLMESLANYSALLYLEKRKGVKALDTVLDEYRANLLARNPNGQTLESAGPIALGTRLQSSQNPGAWRAIVYEKGSWILHMLRRRMGDE
ncbi:MAG: M1 family aminopeptidase, partial [Bryobacteraceae bacterium]